MGIIKSWIVTYSESNGEDKLTHVFGTLIFIVVPACTIIGAIIYYSIASIDFKSLVQIKNIPWFGFLLIGIWIFRNATKRKRCKEKNKNPALKIMLLSFVIVVIFTLLFSMIL